jgi:hypothetical protein
MELAHEAQREGKSAQPFDSVLEGDNVVRDLAQVRRAPVDHRPSLGREQFTQGGLRAFDPARKHSLPTYERPNNQMRVRQPAALPGEPANRAIRVREPGRKAGVPLDGGG